MNYEDYRALPEPQQWGREPRDEEYNHEDKIEREDDGNT